MKKLEALLFDVDGTLADTELDGHLVAFNATFTKFGLDWYWSSELYDELLAVSGGKERIKFYVDSYCAGYEIPDNFEQLVADIHASKTRHYTQLLAQGSIPLRTGVERLLREARDAGLRLAVTTTTSLDNVIALLDHTLGPDSAHWFEIIAAGDIVNAKKPAADIYEYTLKAMNLEAEQCLAIEDSYNGLRAARGANIKTIITINDYTKHHEFEEAVLVLDHLGEPDVPIDVISGNSFNARYVDVALLHKVHAA